MEENAKSKTPACIHKEWSLEIFRIEWVEGDLRQNPHLHCDTCGITAKKALSKKESMEFKGYYDKPERVQACEKCQHRRDVEYSYVDCLYDSHDTDWYQCNICSEVIQGEYLDDNDS